MMSSLNTPNVAPLPVERSQGYWAGAARKLLRDPVAVVSGLIVLALLSLAIFGPWLAPADPYASSMLGRLKPIGSPNYPLGSDELGRDMMSRLIVGARLSLFMGLTPVLLAFVIGTSLGLLAGYAGAGSTAPSCVRSTCCMRFLGTACDRFIGCTGCGHL